TSRNPSPSGTTSTKPRYVRWRSTTVTVPPSAGVSAIVRAVAGGPGVSGEAARVARVVVVVEVGGGSNGRPVADLPPFDVAARAVVVVVARVVVVGATVGRAAVSCARTTRPSDARRSRTWPPGSTRTGKPADDKPSPRSSTRPPLGKPTVTSVPLNTA